MGGLDLEDYIVLLMAVCPAMGVFRGVKNGSVLHALLSVFIPFYGIFYFFIGERNQSED
jgi:hypothetical protein